MNANGNRNFAGIAGELAPIVDLTLEGYEKGLVSDQQYYIPVSKVNTPGRKLNRSFPLQQTPNPPNDEARTPPIRRRPHVPTRSNRQRRLPKLPIHVSRRGPIHDFQAVRKSLPLFSRIFGSRTLQESSSGVRLLNNGTLFLKFHTDLSIVPL
jgi:hypothetical protein